jgi:alpha-beta hydrolase superfamily lysophospholipase
VAIVVLAAVALGGILGWLKWHENELVFATAVSRDRANGAIPAGGETLSLPTTGGAMLAAVRFRADPAQDRGYWVLHLHGNADSAFSPLQLAHCQRLTRLGVSVLCFDYRGYGRSAGEASESGLLEDAESAYQSLRRQGVADDHILFWGHSLGSGPAVYLASTHAAAALVLFGAFTSIPDAAADTYPWLPVRWLVGVRFESLQRIAAVHAPVIIAHTETDALVRFHHAKDLLAAAREPKRLLVLADRTKDGFGGHVEALYDQLDVLAPVLQALLRPQPLR